MRLKYCSQCQQAIIDNKTKKLLQTKAIICCVHKVGENISPIFLREKTIRSSRFTEELILKLKEQSLF